MINFLLGTILGIVVGSVGFSGVAKWADQGVEHVKLISKEVSK